MDTVTMLRDLWRFRLAVVGAAVLAVLASALVLYQVSFPPQSRKYDVGVATASILVDTPGSQVVEISPEGTGILGVRADLLARLMVDGVVKDAIAKNAGIPSKALVGVAASAVDQTPSKAPDRRAPVLTTRVVQDNDGTELPIIELETQAPTAAGAAKLADAALVGLRSYLASKAAAQSVPNARRLQVRALGATQASTVTRGPKNIFAVAAVLFVFGLACACVLLFAALRRSVRAAIAAADAPAPAVAAVTEPRRAPVAVAPQPTVRHAQVPPPPTNSDTWFSSPSRPSLKVAPTPEPDPDEAVKADDGRSFARRRRAGASGSDS